MHARHMRTLELPDTSESLFTTALVTRDGCWIRGSSAFCGRRFIEPMDLEVDCAGRYR